MSEAMTVETIVEADWKMNGFWTKLRFPLRTQKGSWSDIDILAYHPETKVLVIAESKVRGNKKAIYAYTRESQQKPACGPVRTDWFELSAQGVHGARPRARRSRPQGR